MKSNSMVMILASAALSLVACGAGGSDGGGATGSGSGGGAPGTPGGPASVQQPASGDSTVGVWPVADTPIAQLPAHEGHTPLPPTGPKAVPPGPSFPAVEFTREWVVSPSGNDGNAGTREAPLKTITHAVAQAGPGEAVIVLAGTYAEKIDLGDAVKAGEPGRPITLQGEGMPKLVPSNGGSLGLIDIKKPHWVVDGFELDLQGQSRFAVTFQGNVEGSVLANSNLHGGALGGAVTTFANASGARIENNHIHDFSRGGVDSHGVVIQPTSLNITVRHNDIHNTSGDSVQCLGPEGFSNDPPAQGVVIENNHFYGTRENAVDIKTCHDVEIRHNRMHGFEATDSAKGDAVVVHYSAANVVVEDNHIFDAGTGIALGGNREGPMPSSVVIRRNLIHDIHNRNGALGHGIRVENASTPVIVHNTITRVQGPGLVLGGGTGGPTENANVSNNIVDTDVAVQLGSQAPGLIMEANLYKPGATFNDKVSAAMLDFAGWKSAQNLDLNSIQEAAGLNGEHLHPGPAAVDRAAPSQEQSCGNGPDIGAVETGC